MCIRDSPRTLRGQGRPCRAAQAPRPPGGPAPRTKATLAPQGEEGPGTCSAASGTLARLTPPGRGEEDTGTSATRSSASVRTPLLFYLSNVTSWNEKGLSYIKREGGPLHRAHVIGVAEHHLSGKKLNEAKKKLPKLGWATKAIPAAAAA
eukprot:8184129-Pyramimonas_sp.AAC.1